MTNFEYLEGANCASTDPEVFYPEKGGSNRMAKMVCNMCIVRPECLENVLQLKTTHDEFGIIAGLSPRQRAKLRKKAS